MQLPKVHLLVAGLSLASIVGAQERVTIEAPQQPGLVPSDQDKTPQLAITDAPRQEHPLTDLSDDVPLPQAEVGTPGALGDTLDAQAEGDPFFLGFAGGKYYPPVGEHIDPLLVERAGAAYEPARSAEETYAFVMFSKRITPARRDLLEAQGARILGFHPHYTLRVALAPTAIEAVASLDFVRWIGASRDEQKLHPHLVRSLQAAPNALHEVYVNVFDSDLGPNATFTPVGSAMEGAPEGVAHATVSGASVCQSNGWQHAQLAARGVGVFEYVDQTRTFRCTAHAEQIAALQRLDNVQFIEPVPVSRLMHDESIPMINADRARNSFDGGVNDRAVVGFADSGMDLNHSSLNHIWWVGWNFTNGGTGLLTDNCLNGHGSHVLGTILGDPPASVEAGLHGIAPALGSAPDLRFWGLKIFEDNCDYGTASLSTILDRFDDPYTDGNNITTPMPHVVNHSWGSDPTPGGWFGSEFSARLLDDHIRDLGQLQVFAMGNDGSAASSLTVQAAAKNSMSVGNVITHRSGGNDPGTLNGSSSRGPCGDGRWKPNVVAPGTQIDSVDSHTGTGYRKGSGTSMAAPHVTGVAAQLIDSNGFLEYRASLLTAKLMAGALSQDNRVIDSASGDASHLNTYGTGRIDAVRPMFFYGGDSESYSYYWNWSGANWLSVDIPVGPNATRMTVVMTVHEESSSAGASQALVNDIDLWIDRAPFSAAGNAGEFFAHQSGINNSEVRMLENPTEADYRLKVFPDSFPGGANVKVGLSVIVTYGDTTPDATVNVTSNKAYAQVGEDVDLSCYVYTPGANASAVFLDSSSSGDTLTASSTTLIDGIVTDLMDNQHLGRDILLGNLRHESSRTGRWTTHWNSEGVKTFEVEARSDNMLDETDDVQVIVDSTAPAGPTNFSSSTHTPNAGSCLVPISVEWTPATDPLAGLAGYRVIFTNFAGTIPSLALNAGPAATSFQANLTAGQTWWAHIRAQDNAGNWGTPVHLGPFEVSGANWGVYCSGNANSTGVPAELTVITGPCLPTNRLTFVASELPVGVFGHMIMSQAQAFVPFFGGSQGNLCLGAPLYRFSQDVLTSDASGEMEFSPDLTDLPQAVTISAGETWNWQLWFRDSNPFGTSNTTEAIQIDFF